MSASESNKSENAPTENVGTLSDIYALLRTPMPMTILRRGRYLAGAVAAAGAIAFFNASGGVAEAHTLTPKPARSTPPVDTAVYATIKEGETLSSIAAQHGVSVSALVAVNGLKDANKITAGNQLIIPSNSTVARQSGQSTVKVNAASAPKAKAAFKGSAPKPTPGQELPAELRARPDRANLQKHFDRAASQHNVPADLLKAMAWQESGWQNRISSNVGAQGVGQLMPDTVKFVNQDLLKTNLDPKVPEQNIKMSAAYLSYLLRQTDGDSRMALAAYYQGLNAVRTKGLYNDTQPYVQNVLALQARYF